jgi:pimeloyl-ACP methyl ester carboxylesterase
MPHIRTRDGTALHVIDIGPREGTPLVMIPGWSQSAAEFKHQIDDLSRDHRLIAVDMRGHGESEKPAQGYRIGQLAADVADIVAALELKKAVLLGHSMGSSVIWSYIEAYGTARLAGMIVVDQAPACVPRPDWDAAVRSAAGIILPEAGLEAKVYERIRTTDTVAALADFLTPMFTKACRRVDVEWVASENLKLPRPYAAALHWDHVMRDWRGLIATMRLPTLVIGGTVSIFSAESQRWIAAQIPGAACEIFEESEGGGHFMFLENPRRFNDVVRGFMNGR